jgi:hypothetical protein
MARPARSCEAAIIYVSGSLLSSGRGGRAGLGTPRMEDRRGPSVWCAGMVGFGCLFRPVTQVRIT